MSKVYAVVVTYNRMDLLLECLNAILAQSIAVQKVIIVDNASTDGTKDSLNSKGYLNRQDVEYVLLPENAGGAGGFFEGMKKARDENPDWIWVMDDDAIPAINCLEELLYASDIVQGNISFLASSVRGSNGEAMNVPKLAREQFHIYYDWYEYLDKGIVKIAKATFVSLLINFQAVRKCGLPWKGFFIWGDDSEYTQRLIRDFGSAYMVGSSKVIHKRASAESLSLVKEENKQRIPLYYYYYRNNLIGFWEYENIFYRLLCLGKLGYDFFGVLLRGKYKLIKMKILLKAFFSFLFGTYDRKSFKNRASY